MARYLSLYRRRPNLVDINLQSGPYAPMALGLASTKVAKSYSFYVAANFDTGSPTLFQVVPASGGYRSPSVVDISFSGEQFSQSRIPFLTRFQFCPSDYVTGGKVNIAFTTAGVTDLTPFWLTIIQTNIDGSTNAVTAPHLILPYSSQPNRTIILAGTAPASPTVQEIQLPMQVDNFQFQNNGSDILEVAFEPTGPTFPVQSATIGLNLYEAFAAASQVFVSGSGGTTTFSMIAALRNNPT